MNEDDDRLSPEELSALRGPESPPASVEEATVASLRAMGVLRRPHSFLRVRPLPGLLALCASFLLGFGVSVLLSSSHPSDSQSQFLLILYGSPRLADRPGVGHRDEYVMWARRLASRGQLAFDGELSGEVEHLESQDKPKTPQEMPVGFFVLRASNRTEALQLSMACPHLRYGGRVELRPLLGPSGS
jgi:hypothetical protein